MAEYLSDVQFEDFVTKLRQRYARLDNGKIAITNLPDFVVGQMLFGGTVDADGIVTLSGNAKSKYGIQSLTLTSTNAGNYEGMYLIASANASSGVVKTLGVLVGDWVVSNGADWKKIDNTDAVASVAGKTGVVVLEKSDVGLGNVENVAISGWAGSDKITTVGTIASGTWHGTAIADDYIASAATWNAKQNAITEQHKLAWSLISGAPTKLSDFTDDVVSGKYLPLSGGIISTKNSSDKILTLNNSSYGYAALYFSIKGVEAVKIGVAKSPYNFTYWKNSTSDKEIRLYDDGILSYSDNATGNVYSIYHSGNSNKTDVAWSASSLTLNGALSGATTGAFSGLVTAGSLKVGDATLTWDADASAWKLDGNLYATGFIASGGIGTGGSGGGGVELSAVWDSLKNNTDVYASIKINDAHIPTLAISKISGLQSAMDAKANASSLANYQLASTAINTGNISSQSVAYAATASTLQTSRTIWGKSFDGSANIGGTIQINRADGFGATYAEGIRIQGSESEYCGIFLGTDGTTSGCLTTQWNIQKTAWDSFFIHRGENKSQSQNKFFQILNNGNVGINNYNPAYKLDVNGSFNATSGYINGNAIYHTGNLPAYPTTLPASDVYAWAKAATKPSYAFNELTSHPTTLEGYGITDSVYVYNDGKGWTGTNYDLNTYTTPNGILGAHTSTFNGYAIAFNVSLNWSNVAQTVYKVDGRKNVTNVYLRGWHNENGWSETKEFAFTSHLASYQPLATAINTGNIGSQSVNYANSAGSVSWGNVSGRPTALSSFTDDVVSGNYLPLSGGTLTSAGADILMVKSTGNYVDVSFWKNNTRVSEIGKASTSNRAYAYWQNSINKGEIRLYDNNTLSYVYDGQDNDHPIYHSGNSNKSDVDWNCNNLVLGGSAGGKIYTYNQGSMSRCIYGYDANYGAGFYRRMAAYAMLPDTDADDCWQVRPYDGTYNDAYITVLHGGNVGIGTTSPTAKFMVDGVGTDGSANKQLLKLNVSGALGSTFNHIESILAPNITAGKYLCLFIGKSHTKYNGFQISHYHAGDGSASNYISLGAHSNDDILNITYGGNVGIGTASPAYKLDVNGSFNATSAYITETLSFYTDGVLIKKDNDSILSASNGSYRYCSLSDYTRDLYLTGNTVYLNTGNTERLTILQNGNVGIGTTSPTHKLHVAGNTYAEGESTIYKLNNSTTGGAPRLLLDAYIQVINEHCTGMIAADYYGGNYCSESGYTHGMVFKGGRHSFDNFIFIDSYGYGLAYISKDGNFAAKGQVTAGQASDNRLKSNITNICNAVSILRNLRGVEFDWNGIATEKCGTLKGHDVGLIAQEVMPFIPSAVSTIFEDYYRLDYTKLTPYLLAGWQEHDTEIEMLKRRVKELENELKQLKS